MKQITSFLFAVLTSLAMMAQTPQSFKYQTVARNNAGDILASQNITFRMSILQNSPGDSKSPGEYTMLYSETHAITTNAVGLATLEIGRGTPVTGSFATINWSATPIFLKTEIDPAGGSDFVEIGTSELLSVPYALYAENTANNDDADADPANELQTIAKDGQTVTLSNGGGSFTDEVNDSDADPANELQTLTQNGLEVLLSQNGGTINVADNDNDPTNEYQNLSNTKNGNLVDIEISNGAGTAIDVSDSDSDPVNEIQQVQEQGYQVTLSQGGGSFMTGVKSYTQAEIDAMTPYNGLTVINTTTNCVNYYTLNNWFEACGTCTPQPTQAAAGDDQNFTDNTTATTLAGNTPTHGTGLWTVQTGEGGSFDDDTNPAATFTGEPCTSYTLAWSISTSCGTSTDNVEVSFFATPTEAYAGNDTVVEGGDVTLYLSANTPIIGTGLWSVLAGEGGTFDDATNPQTLFTGLPEVTYTLQWAIATVCDTSYDEVTVAFYTWQCGSPFTDSRDSKTYNTVQIGDQCWMAQNLNIGTRIAGSGNQANNTTIEKYCCNNSEAQCDVYGGLYQWNEMMNYTTTAGVQGICPDGWHLPTDAEWTALTTFLGGESVAGGKMKETGTTHWTSPNTGATNSSGFTALPGGYRDYDGSFYGLTNYGYWWSSTEYSTTNAWRRGMFYDFASVNRAYNYKSYGFSVRCLKD